MRFTLGSMPNIKGPLETLLVAGYAEGQRTMVQRMYHLPGKGPAVKPGWH